MLPEFTTIVGALSTKFAFTGALADCDPVADCGENVIVPVQSGFTVYVPVNCEMPIVETEEAYGFATMLPPPSNCILPISVRGCVMLFVVVVVVLPEVPVGAETPFSTKP